MNSKVVFLLTAVIFLSYQPVVVAAEAWETMAADVGDLLQGLPEGISQVKYSSGPEEAVWGTGEDLGFVEGEIIISQPLDKFSDKQIKAPVYVAFFTDAKWSSPPVQVRKLERIGRFSFNDIVPGRYVLAVLAGDLDKPEAIGIESDWPKAVVVRSDRSNKTIKLNLSRDFARAWWESWGVHRREILARTVVPKRVIIGHVIDREGKSIRNAIVQIREHQVSRKGGITAPDIITDKSGYFFYDKANWPYTIGIIRYFKRPEEFGRAWQYIYDPTVHQGPELIRFIFDDMPTGRAIVKGRIKDENGLPVTVPVKVKLSQARGMKQYPKDHLAQFGFEGTYNVSDGSFQMLNIPAGHYTIHAYAPKAWKKFHSSKKIKLNIKQQSVNRVDIILPRKNLCYYYGQVLSTIDKQPVESVSIRTFLTDLTPEPESEILAIPDASGVFELCFESEKALELESGKVKCFVEGPEYERIDFNGNILSKDRQTATLIFIKPRKQKYDPFPAKANKYSIGDKVDDVILYDLDGNIHHLYDHKGKIVLLNFFATWCGPCIEELPYLKKLWEKNKGKDFVVLSIDVKEMPGLVKEFVAKRKLSWPVYLDQSGKVQNRFVSVGLPTSLLLDKSMRISFISVGSGQSTLKALSEKLEKLLQ